MASLLPWRETLAGLHQSLAAVIFQKITLSPATIQRAEHHAYDHAADLEAALDELAVIGEPVNRVLEVDLDGEEVTLHAV